MTAQAGDTGSGLPTREPSFFDRRFRNSFGRANVIFSRSVSTSSTSGETMGGQPVEQLPHQDFRHRRAAAHPNGVHPFQPLFLEEGGVVHQVGGAGSRIAGYFHQANRVGGVGRAHHDKQVALRGDRLNRGLAVRGGVADVVTGRIDEVREAFPQRLHRGVGLIDRQGGL